MKRICLILILSFLIPVHAHAIKYKGDLESNESVTLPEQGSAPSNPAAGKKKIYVKTDGLHVLDSAGVDQFINPFTIADEAKLDGIETAATADQTNVEIKTTYEANADTNAFDDTEQSKLVGIEALADVTDTANVDAAGAVMDSDISVGEGFLRKTGAGAYEGIKSNLNASTNPGATDDSAAGYAVGSVWINTTAFGVFKAIVVSVGAALWSPNSTVNGTVAAAGAVMDSDISASEGILRKTGSGTYEAIKSNFSATADPTVNEDSGDGYAIGSTWINVTLDKVFMAVDVTTGAAVWKQLSP